MASHNPMDVLRELAEKKLNDTTVQLGSARQAHVQETSRLEQLRTYSQEYRQQMQTTLTQSRVSIMALQTQQRFLTSLDGVVEQQVRRVSASQFAVDNVQDAWKKDKQRLNAFEALKNRAEAQQLLKENRLEQKLMDEFARRASQRNI
ncbi:flagellar export protein FliJ [Kosakonia pseudosacchari]|uniref:flagellar export protein FliJ n=1 Tax=Kosakonia pseudosacchari TaxID=1646340 RepID=UPI000A37C056|nr:flagellar export protein FliJ [Kosakonia pseudosacchari]QOV63020.1 flagellar export protein FliJ [Kosakonia pseudosacchari]WBU50445.1 flagellar export protein FliJ [Kosakonia pseudosacchari]